MGEGGGGVEDVFDVGGGGAVEVLVDVGVDIVDGVVGACDGVFGSRVVEGDDCGGDDGAPRLEAMDDIVVSIVEGPSFPVVRVVVTTATTNDVALAVPLADVLDKDLVFALAEVRNLGFGSTRRAHLSASTLLLLFFFSATSAPPTPPPTAVPITTTATIQRRIKCLRHHGTVEGRSGCSSAYAVADLAAGT